MKLTKRLLIIIFVPIMLVAFITGCTNPKVNSNSASEDIAPSIDTLTSGVVPNQKVNLRLNAFLYSPISLPAYKESKDNNYVTTSVSNGMSYHLHPKHLDSIFYVYNITQRNRTAVKRDNVLVFKYRKGKHIYDDDNEVLIGLDVYNDDSDLGRANLVGLTKSKMLEQFGPGFQLINENIIYYSHQNKILILYFENTKVKSFRYLKLSTEKITESLISEIIEN
jgi:hypothetical protein